MKISICMLHFHESLTAYDCYVLPLLAQQPAHSKHSCRHNTNESKTQHDNIITSLLLKTALGEYGMFVCFD